MCKTKKINKKIAKQLEKQDSPVSLEKKPEVKERGGFFKHLFSKSVQTINKVDIHFGWTRNATKRIIKQLFLQKVDHFYFYSSIANIFYILEQGIKPVKFKKLKENEKYIVWTYLEKDGHIELELSTSSRHQFWSWCLENEIDLTTVAIFYIDLVKLYENTKKDWEFNNNLQRVIINELISVNAIRAILIKDMEIYKRLQQYVSHQQIDIKIFYGDKGIIEEIKGKELKVNE
ncbi:acetyltransferase [Spiroplasma endosymbiont of Asaphidion curtum]|uniref:acetyltransferase n=1 Tax=Spiroplasma endosymbiont of Asaphidion curtum TaxID=3066281 RepID=UPI00313AB3D6